jgi:hypothetical protein
LKAKNQGKTTKLKKAEDKKRGTEEDGEGKEEVSRFGLSGLR